MTDAEMTARNVARYRTAIAGARDFDDRRQRGGMLPHRGELDQNFAMAELCGQAGYQVIYGTHLKFRHSILPTIIIRRRTLSDYQAEYYSDEHKQFFTRATGDLPAVVAYLRAQGLAALQERGPS